MMTVSPRAAHPSQLRISLAAVRSCFLLVLLSVFAGLAFGQGLSPDTSITFGSVNLGKTGTNTVQFTGPAGGVTIGTITAVTEGATAKDFNVVSTPAECSGTLLNTDICTIEITFTPTQIGSRLGALVITNNNGAVVNTIYLSGVGVGPQFVFAPAKAIITSTVGTLSPSTFTAGAAVQDSNGNLFFTDPANNRILERSSAGVFTEVTSLPVVSDTSGIAIDGDGNLYVSSGSSVYSIVTSTDTVTTLTLTGYNLNKPTGLAVDALGHLYIADAGTDTIYQFSLGTTSATIVPLTGAVTALSGPTGLAIDSNNDLYIADTNDNRVVKIALGTFTTSLVPLTSLTLSNPTGVAVDAAGTLYIANTGGADIIESTATGDQFVLADPALTLSAPAGSVIEDTGNLVITDTSLGLVYIPRSSPFLRFPTPTLVGSLDASDDPETLTVQETGNIPSTLMAAPDPSFSGTNPTAFPLGTTGSCPSLSSGGTAGAFAIGQVCTYAIDFQPTVVGPNKANLNLATTATNADGTVTTTGTAKLFGIGISTLNHFTLVAETIPATTPTTVNLGGSVELILTAIQSDGAVATDYVGTVTFSDTDTGGKYLGGTSANGGVTTTYTFTAANNGVLIIPVASGLQLNQYGVFTATATAAPSSLPPGAHGVATSNDIYVVEPSTLTLTSSVNPSQIGQSTTFTLQVATTGTVAPTGTVIFYSDGVAIGSPVTLGTTGSANINDIFTATGRYAITATYTSTSNTQGGTASLTQVVGNATTVTLTSSVNPSLVGQSTTLTAIVGGSGTPTGTVTFYNGGTVLGMGTLSGGMTAITVSFPAAGTYTLKAVYGGSGNNQTATSPPVTQVVLNAVTIALTSSVNPVLLDNPTILTALLTSTGPVPIGMVSFFDGGTPIGSGTIINGVVSISASFVYAGTHTITATYAGNATTGASTSPALSQTVADFSLTVASGGSNTASTVAGGTGGYSLVVTPIITSTLPSAVSLTFSGLPSSVTGVLTPTTIAAGSGTTPVTFSVTAAYLIAARHNQPPPAHRSPARYAPVALALMALPLAWRRRRKRFGSFFASVCLLLALTSGLTGCVSDPTTGYYGQTPKTYNLTVTATSGNLVRSTYLTLTVQ